MAGLDDDADDGKPTLGEAWETVTLEGKEFTLKPSLELANAISNGPGGFLGAINRCKNWDLSTLTQIVKLGCDKLASTKESKVRSAVYAAGIADISLPCIRITESLLFGGKRPPAEGDAKTGDDAIDGDEGKDSDPLAASA